MNFSHLATKLRSKITRFSGMLSQDLDKTAQRFVREAVYGIMASQSVMLTEIGRQQEGDVCLKKMEYLTKVRDGSEGGEIVDGYWTNQVIASEVGSNEILAAIDQVGDAVNNRGIWVIDRGGDRDALFLPLLQKKRDFIIRMVGTRDLRYQEKMVRSLWLAYACKLPHRKSIVKIIDGKEVIFNLVTNQYSQK